MHTSGQFIQGLGLIAVVLLQLSTCSPTTHPITKREPTCTEVTIPVMVSANCINMAPTTTFQQALSLVTNTISFLISLLFDNLITGTFYIAGRYCEPANFNASRTDTLQFLLHGATYDRNYWSGDGAPGSGFDGDTYSWVDYASQQGYPTLAIDRLGSGASDHPDPILVVQTPTEVEIANAIIQMARQGTSPFPRQFSKVIVAGHSMGSVVTQLLSVNHPTVADAIILTGYSKYIINFLPGIFATALLLPAAVVQPSKYGNLPIGYLEASSFSGIEYLFWYDPHQNGTYYDPKFPAFDYAMRESLTVGEGATGAVAAATSSFTGPVMVATGQQDTLFCGTTALPVDGPGQCVGGPLNYLQGTGSLYPNARYSWYNVPNAGHCWHFHFTAQLGFQAMHNWLANEGF